VVDQGLPRDPQDARVSPPGRPKGSQALSAPRRKWLRAAAALAAGAVTGASAASAAAAAADDLDGLRALGVLKIAVYRDFFPFSDDGRGIDVDLAGELARRLGLKPSLLPFDAGEDMGDDLRNMVWKGHYLGYGPADVLMHVPVDRVLQARNEQVEIFAPYYRETVRLAIDTERIPDWTGADSLQQQRIAVDGASIGAQVILGADGGRYRDQVSIGKGVLAAIDEVKAGRAAAILAARSEIEAGLGLGARYRLVDVAWPTLPARGWAVGLAVKRERAALAHALADAMDALTRDGTLARIFAAHGVTPATP